MSTIIQPIIQQQTTVLVNLTREDAFAEAAREVGGTRVHLRVRQRTGRSFVTVVEGLSEDLDLKKILKAFKKNFKCNGSLKKKDEDKDAIIQLSGDQRLRCRSFLVELGLCSASQITIHGA